MLLRISIKTVSRFPYTYQQHASYRKRVNVTFKRGHLLNLMTEDKNKKKNRVMADFAGENLQNHKSKGVFDIVTITTRRQAALNKLFIQNISDVLATTDIASQIMGRGIEITGVKVSQDYRLVNVYWQIPSSQFHLSDGIHLLLNKLAPDIRSELIHRHVLGRVPHVFFVRDIGNANNAKFEEALKKADFGPDPNSPASEEVFGKNMYLFKSEREPKEKTEKVKNVPNTATEEDKVKVVYEKPDDMKSNVFGIDHEAFMSKVTLAKKTAKHPPKESAVVSAFSTDLFSSIPGSGFQGIEDREQLLKQFCLDRKLHRIQNEKGKYTDDMLPENKTYFDVNEDTYDDRDYIEED